MKIGLSALQPLGRALMLPIAVLPVAGLLLRLGQPDLLNIPFLAAAGQAVFANLGLLFAIGVAVGFARDNNGAAGLAGVVCFLVATEGAKILLSVPPETVAGLDAKMAGLADAAWRTSALARLGVPIGIASGVIAGWAYNRFSTFKLPEYLAFFSGRRFVPIVCGVAGLGVAAVVGFGFPVLDTGIDGFSHAIVNSGEIGLFVYGVLNRLLIVTGLHHILNNVPWFILGEYQGKTGDIARFLAGDPTAGGFMAGFFPVMMFGLPAACLAMYRSARPERRKAVGGMYFSLALTAFLTGVTEPIEFTFMFLAPVLYAIHAVLTGAAMVVMHVLDVRLGFSFSAGLFDYVLNFGLAERPLLLIPVGLAYSLIYYALFRFFIVRFDLKTPGREPLDAAAGAAETAAVPPPAASGGRGPAWAAALGGAGNLSSVAACTTRLRLVIRDRAQVDEAAVKALGSRGLIYVSPTDLQIVLGPIADSVADDIRAALTGGGGSTPGATAAADPAPAAATASPAADGASGPSALAEALGGRDNLALVDTRVSRLCVIVKDRARVDWAALTALATRGVVDLGDKGLQIVAGPATDDWAAQLRG